MFDNNESRERAQRRRERGLNRRDESPPAQQEDTFLSSCGDGYPPGGAGPDGEWP